MQSKTQNILKLAACLGNQFDVKNLALVSQSDTLEVIENLRDAIDNELITLRPKSQSISEGKLSSGHYIKIEQSSLTFVHERIQQAAYSLIPEDRRKATHLQICRLLLQQIKTSEREEKIFDALDRLNTGMELITDISEPEELAKLTSVRVKPKAVEPTLSGEKVSYVGDSRRLSRRER